jgi:YjbR
VTPNDFRRLALALPGTVESSHMRHPDFRVGNRIFATLGYPDDNWAMVKLKPDQQTMLATTQPSIFKPVKGAWGLRGSTNVSLGEADGASVENALSLAWQNLALRTASPASAARRSTRSTRTKRKSVR